jgi:hypothetical protein
VSTNPPAELHTEPSPTQHAMPSLLDIFTSAFHYSSYRSINALTQHLPWDYLLWSPTLTSNVLRVSSPQFQVTATILVAAITSFLRSTSLIQRSCQTMGQTFSPVRRLARIGLVGSHATADARNEVGCELSKRFRGKSVASKKQSAESSSVDFMLS